jgi:hypothetical protein
MSWASKRHRLERLEQRTGIGQPERTWTALMERMLDRWGDDTPVKKWVAETDEDRELLALFAEVDDDPPQYQPTPEEQLAEQEQGTCSAGPGPAPGQTDSPDVLPLPNGLHELPTDDPQDEDDDEDDTDED